MYICIQIKYIIHKVGTQKSGIYKTTRFSADRMECILNASSQPNRKYAGVIWLKKVRICRTFIDAEMKAVKEHHG